MAVSQLGSPAGLGVGRLTHLDALRALAASAVVLFHLNEPFPIADNPYQTTVGFGWLGVQVFFVLSGFVIFLSTEKSSHWGDFVIRRGARILPGSWASLGVVLGVVAILKLTTGVNDYVAIPRHPEDWLAIATLASKPVTDVETINWVYWSLSYELAFYLVVTLGLVLKKLRQLTLLLTVMVALLPFRFGFYLDLWPLFAIGAGTYGLIRREFLYGSAVVAFSVLGIVRYLNLTDALAMLFALFCIMVGWLRPMTPGWLAAGGRSSYSLYLLHIPIGIGLLARFKSEASRTFG